MLKKMISLLICVFLILINGCSARFPLFTHKESALANLGPEYVLTDSRSVYEQTLELIKSAQKSVYLEQTKCDDPRIVQLLIEKSHQGLEVRVLLDQWEKANRATLETLKSQNVSAQFYPARKGQYDHVNVLVIDQKKVLISGAFSGTDLNNNHDLAVILTGKSAWRAATVFAKDWEFTTTLSLNVPKTTSEPEDNIVITTNANVKQQIQEQISASTKSILLEVSELSDQDTVQALIDATSRKNVRVIVDAAVAKSTPVTIDKLKAGGVKVRFYKGQKNTPLSFNLGIFDGKTFILTSSDWTYYSFVINHELSVTIPSPAATTKISNILEQDWAKSSSTP